MDAAFTSSSTIVCHEEPDQKGQHDKMAGQHQKKKQQNVPSPAGISNPIAVLYIPVWENSV